MHKHAGRLQFVGWHNHPWKLITEEGEEIDLWPIVDEFLQSLDGQRASHIQKRESYTLRKDEESSLIFKHKTLWLSNPGAFEGSNVLAHMEQTLIWLSGRMVEFEISDTELKISVDPSEEVHGVYFFGEGNSCRVLEEDRERVCKPGKPDCCIFMAVGGDGFTCEKFNGWMARHLLDRLAKGEIRASRIGSCAVLGREPEE